MSYSCKCPSCQTKVGNNEDSICCDKCSKWYHLKCSELSQSQFSIFKNEKSFEWLCKTCSMDFCGKCELIFRGRPNAIACDNCDKWFHLKCSGLNATTFKNLTDVDYWHCFECKSNIFPFHSTDLKKHNLLIPLFLTMGLLNYVVVQ